MTAKISNGNSGYDITFATSVDVPGFLARELIQPLDLVLIPNAANLAPEWQDPGYDPGNKHSMPYMWWTTGFAYDTEKIPEDLTSWAALWDARWKGKMAMLDDYREAFGAALIRLGYSVNTTSDAELDAALELLQQQKPLLRKYTSDLSGGDVWLSHAWGSDIYQVVQEKPSVTYVLPEEGGIRGSDTMVLLAGAKHPIAAQLFINHMLDAQVSAANTNYIGYMGPNQAAKEFIDPAILDDPSVNPDKAKVAKLQELLDLGPDLQKYQERWTKLRAGA
jgi:spermidine/putrescine transport system substrate-binding protein